MVVVLSVPAMDETSTTAAPCPQTAPEPRERPGSLGPAPLDVLVIGAGQAGLSLGWHLARRGLRYLLVDAGPEPGHSWRTRWDSLRLFTPAQYDSLPGSPFPGPADTYPSKDEVADYLATYATTHSLPVLTRTEVVRLSPCEGGFVAHTTQGRLTARQVVIATGPFHTPFVPAIEGSFGVHVPQVHSQDYRNPDSVAGERVLVVGAGNSGLQIAEELSRDRDVVLAASSHAVALPQRFAGRDLFWWLLKLGLMRLSAGSVVAQRVRARGDLVIGTDRRGLARSGVDFRPRLVAADGDVVAFGDGSTTEIDAVVWCTGFRADYAWIDADVTDEAGRLRHARGATPVPGLWVLGLPWQSTRGSSLLGFVQRDAATIADQICGTAAVNRLDEGVGAVHA